MKPIITVDRLSKRYRIGATQASYSTLRESLTGALKSPAKFLKRNGRKSANTIWALRNASFEVMPGEVVGVIGRNGAGKSTLLKILSRITEPTTGHVDLYGRVGSLLEVGTGFHAELTGRENTYLSGAILGMQKREIKRSFDEIVAFAEIEKFIDTPVKHYSSGMYMRLAFSVAAHLDPEILLVDEVLAVGDASFQRKCLGKMDSVAKKGRTVVFVSHNMGAISHLCTVGMFLEAGEVAFYGNTVEAVERYTHKRLGLQDSQDDRLPHVVYQAPEKPDGADFAVTRVEVLDLKGEPKPVIATWDDLVLRVWFYSGRYVHRASVVLELAAPEGSKLLLLSTQPDGRLPLEFEPGEHYVDCIIEKIPFAAGEYILGAGLACPNVEWLWRRSELTSLTIVPRDVYGSGLAPSASRSLVAVTHRWRAGERDTSARVL
jgi:lipopolysaccharide transport system ATP-binding protein